MSHPVMAFSVAMSLQTGSVRACDILSEVVLGGPLRKQAACNGEVLCQLLAAGRPFDTVTHVAKQRKARGYRSALFL
jgi:hypothetical protein